MEQHRISRVEIINADNNEVLFTCDCSFGLVEISEMLTQMFKYSKGGVVSNRSGSYKLHSAEFYQSQKNLRINIYEPTDPKRSIVI